MNIYIMNNFPSTTDKALQIFAELMIKKIEEVSEDYKQPWFSITSHGVPENVEGRIYHGINSFLLYLLQEKYHYITPVYTTYMQAKQQGFQINKGEKAFPVLYWNFVIKDVNGYKISMDEYKTLSKEEQQHYNIQSYTKVYQVFNVDQTNFAKVFPDKWKDLQQKFTAPELKDENGMLSCSELDHMLEHNAWLCPIDSSYSDVAYYSPSKDCISIPAKVQFDRGEDFYITLLHEMAHSTGAESRLNRDGESFSENPLKYAKEELTAELASAVSCQALGIVSCIQETNAQYLKWWLEEIKEKPKYLYDILTNVGKASQMILNEVNKMEQKIEKVPISSNLGKNNPNEFQNKNGQFSLVERTYREDGSFSFTGKEKINGSEDVAYIFKQLEDYSIENAFAVLVNKGTPTIIHLGMGSLNETLIDLPALELAFNSFGADQIYFVHNHPSGNLKCSAQDMGILNVLKKMFPDKMQDGIIINTISGKYGVFTSDGKMDILSRPHKQEEYPLKLYSFSKMVFSPNYNPATLLQVNSAEDVAALVSSARLGTRQKISYLIVNISQHIVANVHTPFKTLNKHEKELVDEMVSNAFKFTGNRIIIYGDFDYERKSEILIAQEIKEKTNGILAIQDYVIVPGLHDIQKKNILNAAVDAACIGNFQPFMELKEQNFVLSTKDIEVLQDKLDQKTLTTIGFIFKLQLNPPLSIEPAERENNNISKQLSLIF